MARPIMLSSMGGSSGSVHGWLLWLGGLLKSPAPSRTHPAAVPSSTGMDALDALPIH